MNEEKKQKKEIPGNSSADSCAVLLGQSKDGKTHAVLIGALKVVIVKDGPNTWFAQGLDIDYAAQGNSVESVKKNFENGLVATIDIHLKAYSGLAKLLKPAPENVWQEMFYGPLMGQTKAVRNHYFQISVHSPDSVKKFTLFENIDYFELAQAA